MRVNLLDVFEKTVDLNRDNIAIIHRDKSVSFSELRKKAKQLAMKIISNTDGIINIPIAVFLPKEINTVIADIGIMYSNNPFMNLDVKTPVERIQNIIEKIRPAAVITNAKFKPVFNDIQINVIDIEDVLNEVGENINHEQLTNRRWKMLDTDPLCIINTSGSTGTPKGVVLNHRSFFDFMDWAIERFDFDGSEVMGSLSPVVFDIFDFELCMLMLRGARLVLLDASLASFPARLLELLVVNKVSFIFWVPSIMVNIANMKLLDRISLENLKMIWFAGEVFPTKQFIYWYDKLPNAIFVNMYGPIEITLDCTFYVVTERPDETKPLPIGIPCHNTDILILNEEDKLCSVGEEGELCVRGTSLAMGYYNNPEKTEEVFVQNPLNSSYPETIYRTGDVVELDNNGTIQFKGRKDSLIKHMGYRIELGEIEHVIINDLKLVEYCCAVYKYQKKEIVLYYEKDKEIKVADFRKQLSTVFPTYMIPSSYIRMDLLPRNTNGKIDRLLLKNKVDQE